MNKDDVEALVARALYRGPTVTADQLVGVDACLRQLGGQLALVARPELAQRFGLEPSGTLLIGPPGTGKTTMARFIAGQLSLPFYQVSADEFGSDPDLLHAVFRRLSGERAMLFIDEISILAQKRDWTVDAAERRMLAALLTSLDGLSDDPSASRLWVIGACTTDIHLDPAIHRSGRLGVVVEFALPSQEQRLALLRLYLAGVPHSIPDAELERLGEVAVGASGADVRDWISQAASEVLAETDAADPVIEYRHLETVIVRRGFMAAEGRAGREPDRETALHEAAHAVLAFALLGREALAKVSVGFGSQTTALDAFARGHFSLSDEWALDHPPTSATWPDHAAVALAGAATEELVLGYRGHGAESDVARATRLILDQFDLADPVFGPARATIEQASGVEGAPAGSEAMRRKSWRLTRARFARCWDRTTALVTMHRDAIERLAWVLLDGKRTLTGDEIVAAIEATDHPPVPSGDSRRRSGPGDASPEGRY